MTEIDWDFRPTYPTPSHPPCPEASRPGDHQRVLVARADDGVTLFTAGLRGVLFGDDNYIRAIPLFEDARLVAWAYEVQGGTPESEDGEGEDDDAEPESEDDAEAESEGDEELTRHPVFTRDEEGEELMIVVYGERRLEIERVTARPLTLRELMSLVDQLPTPYGGVGEPCWDFVLDQGWETDPWEAANRSFEWSPLYPQVADIFQSRAERWADWL